MLIHCASTVTARHLSAIDFQVADLDDEFAELLLGDYGENFDAVPAGKVRLYFFLFSVSVATNMPM